MFNHLAIPVFSYCLIKDVIINDIYYKVGPTCIRVNFGNSHSYFEFRYPTGKPKCGALIVELRSFTSQA